MITCGQNLLIAEDKYERENSDDCFYDHYNNHIFFMIIPIIMSIFVFKEKIYSL